ncbi:MAG: sulfatase-like hydrolase/transferase [Rhizomicrobium sp.]
MIFLTDHGEYAAAHGMLLEKWHTAYAEALHVPMVVSHRALKAYPAYAQAQGYTGSLAGKTPPANHPVHGDVLRQCDALTSHVDILPTVLGLAGLTDKEIAKLGQTLSQSRPVPPLPGVNLAPLIRGEWKPDEVRERDGSPRKGVLFITDDEITAPLAFERSENDLRSHEEFQVYKMTVDAVRHGTPKKAAVKMTPGSVKQPQPCALRADGGLQAGALFRSFGARRRRNGRCTTSPTIPTRRRRCCASARRRRRRATTCRAGPTRRRCREGGRIGRAAGGAGGAVFELEFQAGNSQHAGVIRREFVAPACERRTQVKSASPEQASTGYPAFAGYDSFCF